MPIRLPIEFAFVGGQPSLPFEVDRVTGRVYVTGYSNAIYEFGIGCEYNWK